MDVLCIVSGCERLSRTKKPGLCDMHYQRSRSGKPLDDPEKAVRDPVCTVDGCDRKHESQGLCGLHYKRWRAGKPLHRILVNGGPCKHEGCDAKATSKGYCQKHYHRLKRGVPLDREPPSWGSTCTVPGCEKPHAAGGLCYAHYARSRKGQDMSIPIKPNVVPIGSRRKDARGYMEVKTEDGWKLEHRYVMEEKIGRPLLSHETVHHKNGIKSKNDLGNLELWSSSHPAGQRVSDKMEWAIEFLRFYAPEALR